MNLLNINFVTPLSSTNEELRIFPAKWIANLHKQQNFSLPDSLIYYISKNPSSSKVYQKIIQTCKYFFIKNRILTISYLYTRNHNKKWQTKFNEKTISDCINIPCKFWLTEKFESFNIGETTDFDQNFNSYIFPKIYQSDIRILTITNQNISYDKFISLASKCEEILLQNVMIKNDDGSIVALEQLLEALPQLKVFTLRKVHQNLITSKTVEEMIKIPHFTKMEKFYFVDIPETFDIKTFFIYVKKNVKTKWYLKFCNEISEEYKTVLNEVVNEIVQTENHNYIVPFIYFSGINRLTNEKICNLSMEKIGETNSERKKSTTWKW